MLRSRLRTDAELPAQDRASGGSPRIELPPRLVRDVREPCTTTVRWMDEKTLRLLDKVTDKLAIKIVDRLVDKLGVRLADKIAERIVYTSRCPASRRRSGTSGGRMKLCERPATCPARTDGLLVKHSLRSRSSEPNAGSSGDANLATTMKRRCANG